ncbi:MAG: DNA internalization-related competence protein ComEC/Rec2 [Clostridiales bacterium]|nr:DNA internalization-related competence protein ComEC/Rec2 [Clostridiales bacterium]
MLFFKIRLFIVLPCLFVLGFILSYNKTNDCSALCDGLAESRITLTFEGKITDTAAENIVIKADSFGSFGVSPKTVKIICYTEDAAAFGIGDSVSITGRLNKLNPKYNPSDFDEIQYYKCRGISYKMYDAKVKFISSNHNIFFFMSLLRNKAGSALDNMYSAENAGILRAMLLGDKAFLSDEIKLLYSSTGIYHILAISGLHISLIAAMLMCLFKKPAHSIIIITLLVSYAVFTGLSASVVRAVIMMSVFLAAKVLNRRYDIISSISFSAFLILIVNPMYLFDCGFLYSYSSVLGIALFAKPLSDAIKKIPVKNSEPKNSIAECVSAGFGAVAVSKLANMWFFYTVSVYDILLNLVVLPLINIVIFSGAASVLLYGLNTRLYIPFAAAAEFILNFYKISAEAVSALPLCTVTTGRPTLAFAFFYIVFIILLKLLLSYKKYIFLIAAAGALSVGIFIHTAEINKDRTAFLYVGQGDGVVGFAGGKTFVYDGGGINEDIDEKDEGTYTILPYLNYMGKTRVDYAFASHIDNDHLKGVCELIGNIEIGEIFLPAGNYSSDLYTFLKEKAAANNIPITYLSAGDSLEAGKNAVFNCLYPFENKAGETDDINDTSMVLKLGLGKSSFLFTGDIPSADEAEILKSGADISANVIKIPHHGSKYSSSKEFIAAVSPSLAVISCGKNNVYGFPNSQTTDTLAEFDIPCFVTGTDGAVIITPRNDSLRAETTLSQ